MWIYIVDMHFHILADVFFFDNMNYSSKLFNPTSFVIEPKFLQHREERITTICAEKQRGQFLREGLLTFLRSAETVYLYGAGCVAEQMLKILQKEAISIKSILVGDPRKNPKCVHSISVHGYAEVSKEAKDAVVLLALTPRKMNVQQEVFKNLQETGYRNVIVLTEELRQALAGA